jgi:hypothetical protein
MSAAIATHTFGDPLQSTADYLRSSTELVGAGKPLATVAQIAAKRITKLDVAQPFIQLVPAGGFGRRTPVDRHFRVALIAYASTDPAAYDLYELASAILDPDAYQRNGWENASAHIVQCTEEGGIFRDTHDEYLVPFIRAHFGLIARLRPRS